MWAVTGLINNEAHRAYTSWISLRVLYLLLRAAKRGSCEIKRLIYLPAAKPQWLSSPWLKKTSLQRTKADQQRGGTGAGPAETLFSHIIRCCLWSVSIIYKNKVEKGEGTWWVTARAVFHGQLAAFSHTGFTRAHANRNVTLQTPIQNMLRFILS